MPQTDPKKLLIMAYYENLFNRLKTQKNTIIARIDALLDAELSKLSLVNLERQKHQAYHDACIAFVEERIEMYNPIGFQYTFDVAARYQAAELEFQLDWYDSHSELELLQETAAIKARCYSDQKLDRLADEIIAECGAYPDKSIISAYQSKPSLYKLPDYIVAQAIEQTIVGPLNHA